jgi:NADH-quinone oxidoreductase subunit H
MYQWFKSLSVEGQFLVFSVAKIIGVFAIFMAMVAYIVLVERRVCAFIQDRVGPNRTGPFGLLQPLADAAKLIFKEDFTPGHVRTVYFWLAPAITMIPALLTIAVIPFGGQVGNEWLVIADLDVGILYTFGIVSLGVYGIVLAGYAANSKYPFLGGIRSSAQMISYEIAMGLCVIPVFLLVGKLNLNSVVMYQSKSFLDWMAFKQPLAFGIFIIAALAEMNRLPFDLPESEQELVGGYNVEYSSMKFGMFFMAEYANMLAASAMIVTLFLGGWSLPLFGLDQSMGTLPDALLHVGIFLAKLALVAVVVIWIRWMLPRFRYDQLMDLGWRRFIPLALANIVVTAVVLWATTTPKP